MAGASPREQQGQQLYGQLGQFNPMADNVWNSFQYPFGPQSMIGALNDYTNQGMKSLQRTTATNVNNAGRAAASGAVSRGYGGAVMNDLVSGAREGAAASGTNAMEQLQANRLGLLPGIMNTANQEQFNLTGAKMNANFQNIQNMFQKFAQQYGMLGSFSNTNTLDDILAIANTAGNAIGNLPDKWL